MHNYDLHNIENVETDEDTLNSIDSSSTNPIPVIYQSGYLTIKDYDREFGTYYLGFPNREVDEGFMKFLLPFYTDTDKVNVAFHINKFVREVRSGDYDAFFRRLQSFFADTPYELVRDLELHYQNVLFIVYKLIGFYVKAGIPYFARAYRPAAANGQVHLCNGVQIRGNRRGSSPADQ